MENKKDTFYIVIIIVLVILSIYLFITKNNITGNFDKSCTKMEENIEGVEQLKKCPEVFKQLQECRLTVSSNVDTHNDVNSKLVDYLNSLPTEPV